MKHTTDNSTARTILWIILACIPVINLIVLYKVAKLIANHE